MSNLLSIGLALSLALTGITPAQADVKSVRIIQALDQDGRLGPYGPYRLLTEEERRWLLLAQKGGPPSESLFKKTSTQVALIVLRYKPLFRGNLVVQSKPWRSDISAQLLFSMVNEQITRADYFKQVQVYALETPNPTVATKPSTPITPTTPTPNKAPRPQFEQSTSQKVQLGQPLKVVVQVKDETPAKTQATIQLLEGEKVLEAVRKKGTGRYTTTFGPDVTSRLNPQKSYSVRIIVNDGELSSTVRQGVQITPMAIAIKPAQTKPPAEKPVETESKPGVQTPLSKTPQVPPVKTKPLAEKPAEAESKSVVQTPSRKTPQVPPIKTKPLAEKPAETESKSVVQTPSRKTPKVPPVKTKPLAEKPAETESKPVVQTPSRKTPKVPPIKTKPLAEKPETQAKIPPQSETKLPEIQPDKTSTPETKTPAVEPTEKATPENKPPEIVKQPNEKPIEVPSEPIATQTSIPIQITFSDQTNDQIIPGQSLNVETMVTAPQLEKVTLSTQLLDKDTLVKTITLMAKGNGLYQGGLSGQETANLIPGRSYQLKSVADDGNSKAEAIEDLKIAQVATEPDEPFDLQIPTFFNMGGIPRATGASSSLRVTRSLNATYRFTVDIPREANRGVGQLLLEFPDSIVPPSPANIRVLANNNPIEIQKVDLNGSEFDIKLKDAAPPGSSMTVEVPGIRNPSLGGNYDFIITVLPAGDLPAFYALSPLRLIFVDRQ